MHLFLKCYVICAWWLTANQISEGGHVAGYIFEPLLAYIINLNYA